MARIKAGDSTAISIGGNRFIIPAGQEIDLFLGNSKGEVIKESIQTGTGSSYPVFSKVSAKIEKMKIILDTDAKEQIFNDLQAEQELPIVFSHGEKNYTFTGFIVAGDNNGTIARDNQTGQTAEFALQSSNGKIRN